MSEHDWQATVLAELGVPQFGLVTPDPSGSSASHSAPPEAELREPPPARSAPVAPARPVPERETAREQAGEQMAPERPPAEQPPPGWGEPPSAQMRSAPAAPEGRGGRRDAPSSPPAAQAPPDPAPEAQDPQAEASWNESEPPQARDRPGGDAPPQEDAAPDQAAAWELASQTSWGLVAQTSWGTEPPPEDVPEEAPGDVPVAPSEPEAWRRDPEPQAAPGLPAARRPDAPSRPRSSPAQPAPHDLVRRVAHGDPLLRRVSLGVRRVVGASAADEVRKTADVEVVLGRPVPSCRQIAVTSIRGGAGKTTVGGLTATIIAQYRQDRVAAVDADSGLGSLPLRLGVHTEWSLHDLTAANPHTFDEAARFLGRTADGLWVLSGTAGGQINHELDLATFRSAAARMSRYFAAMVVDCGAGLLPELQRGILTDAHAQVMVTPGTVDGALSARGALEWQARNGYGHLLARTVIAFVTHTPHVDADMTRAAQLLSGGGMPVVHMPYDRHLATGTAIESARIGRETRAAAISVALEAFARATSV